MSLDLLFSSSHQALYGSLSNKVYAATRFDFKAYVDSVTKDLHHR